MHWTAVLARRQFPPDARIVGDLSCIGCGYNLHGARAGGNCPECGLDVQASMYTLARPDDVASGYQHIARSYLAHYIILLPVVVPSIAGMDTFLLAGAILLLAACFRLWGSIVLRFRAALAQLPIIRPRLGAMFAFHALDFFLLAAAVLLAYIAVANANALPGTVTAMRWKLIIGGSWLAVSMLGLLITSWATLAVADMLEYDTTRRELIIHIVLMATSPLTAILLMLTGLFLVMASGSQIGALVIRITGVAGAVVIWSLALVYAVVAMLRLAGAAVHERDELDEDLVDSDRSALPHRTRSAREQSSEIRLE